MKFVAIKEVPPIGHRRNELKARLDEFMRMRTKTVEVEWQDTYKSAQYAQNNISRSARAWGLPIDVRRRGESVYLIRRDM